MTSRDKLNLFPSRANYVFVKQRMSSAQKGLELLKRKRDALEIKLREYKAQLKKQQETSDAAVKEAVFSMARLEYFGTDLKSHGMLNVSRPDVFLRFSFIKTIGVIIPQFDLTLQTARSYPLTGLGRGGTEVPKVRSKFQEALKQIAQLASIDYAVKVLEKGVHQNNMRLNGLEFVVLPRYQNTLKYIRDEMDEFEREDFYRLKRGQAKRLQKQQAEIEMMRQKIEDPESFKKTKKKAKEAKRKNVKDWKQVYTDKFKAVVQANYEQQQQAEAEAEARRLAEEEEEFAEEEFDYEAEDFYENDEDALSQWPIEEDGGSRKLTFQSYAIDDPDPGEGSREIMQSRSVLNPLTPPGGSAAEISPRNIDFDYASTSTTSTRSITVEFDENKRRLRQSLSKMDLTRASDEISTTVIQTIPPETPESYTTEPRVIETSTVASRTTETRTTGPSTRETPTAENTNRESDITKTSTLTRTTGPSTRETPTTESRITETSSTAARTTGHSMRETFAAESRVTSLITDISTTAPRTTETSTAVPRTMETATADTRFTNPSTTAPHTTENAATETFTAETPTTETSITESSTAVTTITDTPPDATSSRTHHQDS